MSRNSDAIETCIKRNYKDIIHLPHHVSSKRPQMSLEDRAAQFSPFSAVVGHEASVKEAARLTQEKRDLDEDEKGVINEQLNDIQLKLQTKNESGIEVAIEHFKEDALKSGGSYIVTYGMVKRIDAYRRCIYIDDDLVIKMDDVFWMAVI